MYRIDINVNGEAHTLDVPSNATLLEVLRDNLGLKGVKEGCGKGECGACTVLINGIPVNACLILAVDVDGMEITTIEGLARGDELNPIQESFIEHGAVQCGFCTPGMIMSAKHLLDNNSRPTVDEIKEAISGNLCRCTGYVRIIKAIEAASERYSFR
jgi:carbon-monoxide dehydrogenase small subunit